MGFISQSERSGQILGLSRKMMHDEAVDLFRSLKLRCVDSLDSTPVDLIDPKVNNPADVLEAKERREGVKVSLERLQGERPKYAWVLREHFLKGRAIEDLAKEKGVTAHAIQCQKNRALHRLGWLLSHHSDGECAP